MTKEDLISSAIGVVLLLIFFYLMVVGISVLGTGLHGISTAILTTN